MKLHSSRQGREKHCRKSFKLSSCFLFKEDKEIEFNENTQNKKSGLTAHDGLGLVHVL
jgi:hypothetical protein